MPAWLIRPSSRCYSGKTIFGIPPFDHAPAGPTRPPGAADRVAVAATARPADDPGHHPTAGPFPVRLVGEQLAAGAHAVAWRVARADPDPPAPDADAGGPVPRHGSPSRIGTVACGPPPAESPARAGVAPSCRVMRPHRKRERVELKSGTGNPAKG